MIYTVTVKEVLERKVAVKADSPAEAWEKIDEQYRAEKIVLTADDFTEYSISVGK